MSNLRPQGLAVNPLASSEYYTLGDAVLINAPPLDAEGRDPASPRARQHHGKLGIVVGHERCERGEPRVLYHVAVHPAIQVRLYADELVRYRSDRVVGCHPSCADAVDRCQFCGRMTEIDETGARPWCDCEAALDALEIDDMPEGSVDL